MPAARGWHNRVEVQLNGGGPRGASARHCLNAFSPHWKQSAGAQACEKPSDAFSAIFPVGHAIVPSGIVAFPVGNASDRVGHVIIPSGIVTFPVGKASDLVGHAIVPTGIIAIPVRAKQKDTAAQRIAHTTSLPAERAFAAIPIVLLT